MPFDNSAGAESTEAPYKGKSPNSKGSKSTELSLSRGNKASTAKVSGKVDYPKPF